MANNANEKMYDLMAKYLTRKDVRAALIKAKVEVLVFKAKMWLFKKLGVKTETEKGSGE